MSEIDDIFASKGSIVPPVPSTSSSFQKKGKAKKSAKRKRDEQTTHHSTQHRSLPETVLDTSNNLTKSKRPKIESKPRSQKFSTTGNTADDMKFSDSRGSRPRKTTEEGWLVYKEEELGLRDEGGDTPLCPFDCDCCF